MIRRMVTVGQETEQHEQKNVLEGIRSSLSCHSLAAQSISKLRDPTGATFRSRLAF